VNPKQTGLRANGFSFVSAARGVVYAGSTAGGMVAINGAAFGRRNASSQ
jgi:hypothetical protein